MSDNIIELKIIKGEQLVVDIKKNNNVWYCSCYQFILDTFKREVHCHLCGRKFDAFEALVKLTHKPIHYREQIKRLKYEIDRLSEALQQLKKDVSNER